MNPAGQYDDAFDAMLAEALRARPEPVAGLNLAGEALSRARAYQAQDAKIARLARLSRWMRMATFAAAALVAATVVIGYRLLPADTSTSVSSSATTTTTTAASVDWTTVGMALFLITLIVAALATVLTPDRPQFKLAAS
jgi:negative regulator of sigma E activity